MRLARCLATAVEGAECSAAQRRSDGTFSLRRSLSPKGGPRAGTASASGKLARAPGGNGEAGVESPDPPSAEGGAVRAGGSAMHVALRARARVCVCVSEDQVAALQERLTGIFPEMREAVLV